MWHAKTFKRRVRSLYKNQTILFYFALIGLLLTFPPFGDWVYHLVLGKTEVAVLTKAEIQIGQMWFTPPRLEPGKLNLNVWIKNTGSTPAENMMFFVVVSVAPVPPNGDLRVQDEKNHADYLAQALKFNADQISIGKTGHTLKKGEGAWQTMTLDLNAGHVDGILQGHERIFLYVWSRWRDAPHDLDSCIYLQRPASKDLNQENLIWHFCGE